MISQRLEQAIARDCFRTLPQLGAIEDYCSNDYLGLSTTGILLDEVRSYLLKTQSKTVGSTGSRLISGNSQDIRELENEICKVHKTEASLVYSSGYAANIGLFSSFIPDQFQIFYDEHVHVSIKDGIQLSKCTSQPFRHNDLDHLESRLKKYNKPSIVSVESLYSMDGSFAPLNELAILCARYNAKLIVDEAHSAGVYGHNGSGLIESLGLQNHVFAAVITYGKAFGCQGASVIGSELLKNYQINYSRSFIYSTGLAPIMCKAISLSYELMQNELPRSTLQSNISYFKNEIARLGLSHAFLPSDSAIQSLIAPGELAMKTSHALAHDGWNVKAIRSPTIKRGTERLRFCIHSFNNQASIRSMLERVASII